MSCTTLYLVHKTTIRVVNKYRNSWGSAPILWDALAKKYLGIPSVPFEEAKLKPLWALAWDPKVPRAWRLVQAFTFDRAVCPKEGLGELGAACLEVYKVLRAEHPDRINHWEAIGKDLLTLDQEAKTGKAKWTRGILLGAALQCTSVADTWDGYPQAKEPTPESILEIVEYKAEVSA